MRGTVVRVALALSAVLAVASAAPVAAGAAPARVTTPGADRCPEVTVLAARGSEQNDQIVPTRYSESAPWVSNGYEAQNLRAFLQFAESRYLARTGESLMDDVAVLALDEAVYPAALPLPALAEEGEELAPAETARRLHALSRETQAHVLADTAVTGFLTSLESGIRGVGDVLADYEAGTGCQPDYLLLGYSQGSIVLTEQERELYDAGRLVGAIYLGNPLLTAGHPSTVGQGRGGGLLGPVAAHLDTTAPTPNRINHCRAGDFVCDTSLEAAADALGSGGGEHLTYYLDGKVDEGEAAVADAFASWVENAS